MGYDDPQDPLNGPAYQTGKQCIEGCGRPAGTAWSPYWCQPCNANRMGRISDSLSAMQTALTTDRRMDGGAT